MIPLLARFVDNYIPPVVLNGSMSTWRGACSECVGVLLGPNAPQHLHKLDEGIEGMFINFVDVHKARADC